VIYGTNSSDHHPSDRDPKGFDKNGPTMIPLPWHRVYVLIQICSLPASGSCRTDVITIRLDGSSLYTRRHTTLRPVCIRWILRRPVCLPGSGSMSFIELAATPGHHPSETGQNGPNHKQHEDDARRKTETNSINTSAAGDTGRLFAALTSHNRRRVRQNRADQRSEENPHAETVCYFERSRNR
jgi:hypothetical protein